MKFGRDNEKVTFQRNQFSFDGQTHKRGRRGGETRSPGDINIGQEGGKGDFSPAEWKKNLVGKSDV